MSIMGNMVGGSAPLKTLIIQDEQGAELVGTVVESEVVFTATDNDVREGMTYASDNGVSTGTKFIPSYVTAEGAIVIPKGSAFVIKALTDLDRYDFTKMQAIICPFSTSIAKSVAAEKVSIDNNVYEVNSDISIAVVTKDAENKYVNFEISNDSDSIYILRYFTYKEIN